MDTKIRVFNEVTRRWEQGVPHDARSEQLFEALRRIDTEKGSDYFEWKAGGDGDNGEELMFLLDIHFAEQDAKLPPFDPVTVRRERCPGCSRGPIDVNPKTGYCAGCEMATP